MALRVSIYDAATNALGRYLTSKFPTIEGMEDINLLYDWPPPDIVLSPKTMTILAAGPYEHEDVEPYISDAIQDVNNPLLVKNTWIVAFIEQPLQIDIWAQDEAMRSHMVACTMDLLFYGLGFTLGQSRTPDPIMSDALIALGDGWSGDASFWFDSAESTNVPGAVFANEYRATLKGAVEMTLSVQATSAKLATFIFKERVRESGNPSTYTGTYDLAAKLGAPPPYSKDVP